MLERLWPKLATLPQPVKAQVEADAKYAVYLDRQADEIDRARREEGASLDADFDYGALVGLSRELRDKLATARPLTVGQAHRLEGMTPAAITLLLAHARRPSGARDPLALVS